MTYTDENGCKHYTESEMNGLQTKLKQYEQRIAELSAKLDTALLCIEERDDKIARLEAIIKESKEPVLWCVWDKRNQQVFWSHPRLNGGKEACENYIAAATIPEWLEVRGLLVAAPVMKEKQ